MSITHNDIEYLTTREAAQYVTDGSAFVFKQLREKVRIEEHRIFGKGNSKFFKRVDLDEMKKLMGPYTVE